MQQRSTSSSQGIFSQNNRIRYLQYYNFFTAGLALVGYLTDPKASAMEYGYDIALHVLQGLISENTPEFFIKAVTVGNIFRLGAIELNMWSGSTMSVTSNLVDVVNHGVNLWNNENLDEKHSSDSEESTYGLRRP